MKLCHIRDKQSTAICNLFALANSIVTKLLNKMRDYALIGCNGVIGERDSCYKLVRRHTPESLIPPVVKSSWALALRRNLIPEIILRRQNFDGLRRAEDSANQPKEEVAVCEEVFYENDDSLEEMALAFSSGHSPDELGIRSLFSSLHLDSEYDFFSTGNLERKLKKVRNKTFYVTTKHGRKES
jgi:hypothetical protein